MAQKGFNKASGAPIAGSTLRFDPDERDVRFATTGGVKISQGKNLGIEN